MRHPDLFGCLVAGAWSPLATQANVAELRALIVPARGFRTSMRLRREDLRRLAMATLMIWGYHDPVVRRLQTRAVEAEIPYARLEALPAGHVPQLGSPDRVAARLEDCVMATGPRARRRGRPDAS